MCVILFLRDHHLLLHHIHTLPDRPHCRCHQPKKCRAQGVLFFSSSRIHMFLTWNQTQLQESETEVRPPESRPVESQSGPLLVEKPKNWKTKTRRSSLQSYLLTNWLLLSFLFLSTLFFALFLIFASAKRHWECFWRWNATIRDCSTPAIMPPTLSSSSSTDFDSEL